MYLLVSPLWLLISEIVNSLETFLSKTRLTQKTARSHELTCTYHSATMTACCKQFSVGVLVGVASLMSFNTVSSLRETSWRRGADNCMT